MANKKADYDKKYNITFRLPYWLIQEIKKYDGYNRKIEVILSKYFKKPNITNNDEK